MENIQVIAEGELEQYVFCITSTCLRRLAFEVGELIHFSYAPNQDKFHWNEMMLWVHETRLTTKSEAATW